jgi:hypothetical protein
MMMRKKEIAELRNVATWVISGEPVEQELVQSARDVFQAICQEAGEYGLTTAKVTRAVLTPVFEEKRGCDCPTCEFRRSELNQDGHPRVNSPSTQS